MKDARQHAINECFYNGVGLTGKEFDRELKAYNNFEMPLSSRCDRVAEKKEPAFIEAIKIKYVV